ncbi:MAG: efflux RND transporter periplasmic adaptor subunit [bacterium]|nr:efflux RND transporter periplasmic adaptor subunit [bacterium]
MEADDEDAGPAESEFHEAEERLAWYPLRAPFDGTVIERHLTLGEKHSDEFGAFTIADLTSVWANLAVYQKDLPYVREGLEVTFAVGGGMPQVRGRIAYLAPVVDEKTRTALARVVLPNDRGDLRPGLFVSAELSIGQEHAPVVVPKSAVQRMGEQSVVFLDTDEGFTPAPVALGRSNESGIEILSGLAVGQRYVTEGAFELKAKIVTSGLGAHAGHGH